MTTSIPFFRQLFALTCCALLGCGEQNDYVAPPPPQVTVAQPLTQPIQEYFITTGQTQAVATVELRARVDGFLNDIHFNDGDLVEANQLLFAIEKEPFEIAVRTAEAALAKAQAQLALTEQQLNRATALAAEQATAMSNLDVRQSENAAAAADVQSAEAALADAVLNRDYTEIRAPFAGRIGRHLVDKGNLVQSETTLLATIEAVSPMHAYFAVSETDVLRFRELQRIGVLQFEELSDIPIELALGDRGEFEFSGRLDYREFGIQTSTGTTVYRARFENPEGALIPGMFVRVRMEIGNPQPMLMVEERALAADQRGEYLTVVNSDNVVEHRIVDLGLRQGELRAIESGLQPDDWVVVNGLQRARPGVEVDPQKTTMGGESENGEVAIEAAEEEVSQDSTTSEVIEVPVETDSPPTEPLPMEEPPVDDGIASDSDANADTATPE